jgi:hypothetical protein
MRIFSEGEALAEQQRRMSWCHRAKYFRDSLRGAIITYHDSKHSFDAVETLSFRRYEKQFYSPIESGKRRTQREW